MDTADIERRLASQNVQIVPNWEVYQHDEVYRCHAILWPEAEGGFSAHCANLLGVVSQGENQAEALENIADSFRETIKYYRETATAIPWGDIAIDRPPGCIEQWIAVRALSTPAESS